MILFQKFITQGLFPSDWKHATITPVYKNKGNRFDKTNYRPISLMSSVCKVYKTLMFHHLSDHCDNHSIISDTLHSLRQKHSTKSNLIKLHDSLVNNIDHGNNGDVITID